MKSQAGWSNTGNSGLKNWMHLKFILMSYRRNRRSKRKKRKRKRSLFQKEEHKRHIIYHLKNQIMSTDVSLSPGKELTITRVLNAPIELVWKVWTDPDHIKNWLG